MRISYWSSDVCSSDRNEYRGLAASQPTGDFLVQRRHACARVNQEQRHISRRHRRFRLHTHPSRQALWILILIACCIDDAKIKAKQMRIAFPPIAGNTRPVIDERQLLADEPIE